LNSAHFLDTFWVDVEQVLHSTFVNVKAKRRISRDLANIATGLSTPIMRNFGGRFALRFARQEWVPYQAVQYSTILRLTRDQTLR
jgi:hypothetical protein